MEKVLRKVLLCLGLTLVSAATFAQNSNIQGQVLYSNSYPMGSVMVYLSNANGNVIATKSTNPNGNYHFNNVPAGDYSISFSTNATAGGVELSDAFLLMQHLMNVITLTSFQAEVADVNNSGDLTWDDYEEMMFSYFNLGNPFSGGDWVFETLNFTLPLGSRDGFVSSGGSTGDVNGTFVPPNKSTWIINEVFNSIVVNDLLSPFCLGLSSTQDLTTSGFHLVFDIPSDLKVTSVSSTIQGLKIHIDSDQLRITGMNGGKYNYKIEAGIPFIEITTTANTKTASEKVHHLILSDESHFIDENGEMIPYINLTLPGVQFIEPSEISLQEKIYPNPFVAYAALEYQLASDGNVKVVISNSAGQMVKVLCDEFQTAGAHKVRIEGSDLPTGIYHYGIHFSGMKSALKTGSMIKSK